MIPIRNGLRETPFFRVRFKSRNFSHETIRHFLVDLFKARFRASFRLVALPGKINRPPVSDRYRMGPWKFMAAIVNLKCPKDTNRNNNGAGFNDGETNAATSGLELSIFGTSPFGK